jgi:glycosyltransferase involved in cell wall biosynthesis
MVTARYIPYIGGTEIHTCEVARRMVAAGHEVTVLTTDISRELSPTETIFGVKVVRVPAWPANRDYYFAPDIHNFITRGEWDLIHCQGYHTLVAPLTLLAARKTQTPYLVSFHSGGHPSRTRNSLRSVQQWLLRPLLAGAEKLIGVSKFEVEFFQKRLRLPADRFVTISNGSYLPRPEVLTDGKHGNLIVSVGRLERHKGHQRTIMALPEVAKQYPDVRLRIIGAGPYQPILVRQAERHGVADRVEIGPIAISHRADLASIMAEAKLAMLLSDYESQGIAVLEALSMGLPALVTHTSGLAELADGGLVRSVPLNSSPKTIAAAMIEQLRRPLIRADVSLPTWEWCATQLMELYHTVTCNHAAESALASLKPGDGQSAERNVVPIILPPVAIADSARDRRA